ncbi:MAG: polysaccharide biosynthesis/export family protein [Phycisphaerae bacterium]|nr:polysaccharide biosynthesis/export family protein [Phycisphaerae bacterium]
MNLKQQKWFWISVLLVAAIMSSSGCYNPEAVREFLQEPRIPVATMNYRVFPPDVLLISSENMVELKPELGRRGLTVPVRPDGKVNLPLLGEVFVAGMTIKEIERALLRAAAKYYSEATLAVDIIGYNSQSYYVFGQVQSPGRLRWTGRDTLLDALSKTIYLDTAWPERIIIVRGDSPQDGGYYPGKNTMKYTMTGKRYERQGRPRKKMVINVYAMVREGDLSNNILLMPNDIVYVQRNPFATVAFWMSQLKAPVSEARGAITDWRAIVDKNTDDSVWVSN